MLTLAVTYAGLLGGAERTLLDFARGLPGGVVLACPEGALAERARELGVPVFPIAGRPLELRGRAAEPARAGADLAGHAREVRRLARDVRPDLLLAWGMRSAIVAPAALAGMSERRPALLVRHVDFLPGPLVGRLVRAAARRADVVSVNSHAVARELDPSGRLGARLSVVSPGVELDRYVSDWSPGEEPEALLLGAIVPWKRPDLALEAVALAARRIPGLRLTVAGQPMNAEGERLEASLKRRANQPDLAGRVHFSGHVPDPRELLSRCWCLLHCADREPFGSVVVQALASGRPVVAPDSGGPAEVVDESCGRLYPPGDAEAAASALAEVLSAPQRTRSLGEAGRSRAERFDAREARSRFAEVARRAVSARRGPRWVAPGDAHRGAGMALVTVTYNSRAEVLRLLDSVERHLPAARVVVVDSGSSDDSAGAVRAAHPEATVLELGENVGFGRASNAGVALVEEPVCVLVNPDVELIDGSLAELAAEALRHGSPERLLAPLVLHPDGTRQDTAQHDPGARLLLLKALAPPAALPPPLRTAADPWRAQRSRPIGWAVGCCLLARTETLRRLGPFDERIFLFAEDMDLGLRARREGVETWFCPDARVVHLDAHSTAGAFDGEPYELLARQRRAVVGELRGPRAARRDHLTWLLTYANRIAIKKLARRPNGRERRQLAAQWRARREPARLGER